MGVMETKRRSEKPRKPAALKLRSHLGTALVRNRLAKGWGLRDLARAAGVDPSQLSRIESGQQATAHAATLRKLAQALDMKAEELAELAEMSRKRPAAAQIPIEGLFTETPACTIEQAIEQDASLPGDRKQLLLELVSVLRLTSAKG